MSGFHDVAFPATWVARATVSQSFTTHVFSRASGFEERISAHVRPRRRYSFETAIVPYQDANALSEFHVLRRGRFHGFRFRDRFEWKSSAGEDAPTPLDQILGVGDGTTRVFALRKRMSIGDPALYRGITRPIAGTVSLAVNGVALQTPGFSILASGAVQLANAPALGAIVSAGFAFDVPVRFEDDALTIKSIDGRKAEVSGFALVELLES